MIRQERPLGLAGRVALVGLFLVGAVLGAMDLYTLVFYLSYAAVAAVLIVRRPRNAIGWILLVIAWSLLTTSVTPHLDADIDSIITGTASARDEFLLWINGWTGAAAFAGYFALTILFPSGHFPTGRWRRPAMALLGASIGVVALTAFAPTSDFNPQGGISSYTIPNPFAVLPGLPIWSLVPVHGEGIVIVIGMVFVGAGSMIVRYRRSTGVLRLQLRWLVASLSFVVVAVAFGLGTLLVLESDGGFGWIPATIAYPSVPLAVGVAVLRYHLYEIDRLISRSLSYAAVTSILFGVFVIVNLALQAWISPLLRGGGSVAVAASTLLVAALFNPVRGRVQRAVDRRFDRARYDADQMVRAFAGRLRDDIDLAAVSKEIVDTATTAVRPTSVTVWLRGAPR